MRPDLRDTALCHGVLAAIAQRNHTRGGIAGSLERPGQGPAVWDRSEATFRSKVVGPHFEQVWRTWTPWYASPDTLGGQRTRVESGTVADPGAKTSHEIDAAGFGRTDNGREVLLAIGEAEWNETMGVGHLERLRHIRDLLQNRTQLHTPDTRLLCFSGTSFTDGLCAIADHDPRSSSSILTGCITGHHGTQPE
ncbi:hypothetical protein OG453_28495 [Streptomyces sp. NBC_01381]|uniref:hypothetical protein n=1 Tax=Streptomyces sp. NBC_01381 TaxID=2903845 RepID=UPI002258F87F|nr:hypothetical protein [Streptomyces sp. NBC_01381]MCX4670586.1 hypothetical protein [Streptomyces sp. NBC_01381]